MPLHPFLVHLPIAMGLLSPLIVGFFMLELKRRPEDAARWTLVVIWQTGLALSVYAAMWAGEREMEGLQGASEALSQAMNDHKDAASLLMLLAVATIPVAALGQKVGQLGAIFRWILLAQTSLLLAFIIWVGSLGGELVYVHGAAGARKLGPVRILPDKSDSGPGRTGRATGKQ